MIEYFIISLAVVSFAGQFAFTKSYEKNIKQTLTTATSLLFFTSVVGTLIYLCVAGFKIEYSNFSFIMALAFALVMLPYYIVSVKVLTLGSLAVYSLFMMLGGMLLPFVYGIAFLSEEITWGKVVGTVLLTASMLVQAIWQNGQETQSDKKSKKQKVLFFVLCIVVFIVNGLTAVIAKAHAINEKAINEPSFMVWSCLLTVVLGGILLGVLMLKKDRKILIQEFKTTLKLKPFILITIIGAAMYTGNFLLLLAADKVPASVQFPMVSGGVIVLSALASVLAFKEKLSIIEWISVAGACISTVLYAF